MGSHKAAHNFVPIEVGMSGTGGVTMNFPGEFHGGS